MAIDNIGTEEVTGDKYIENPIRFELCKHLATDKNNEHCKWIDNQGYCPFECCIKDEGEQPPERKGWTFTCIICGNPCTMEPKNMKIHWCRSCIEKAQDAEKLPFTCRYCGKEQNKRSQWMFSKVCDECIPKLYSPNCKNYKP